MRLADEWRSSGSLVGELKYGEDFKHYDYVNPDAPKGGTLNSVAGGSFDSFNPFIVRGSAAAGLNYRGGLLYDTLMTKALDEGSTNHALIADAFKYPDDFSSATYRLDARAKWHDGTPITVDDVIWSFNFLKANSPNYVRYFGNVTEAVAVSDREVEFRFDQKGNRELPHILGDLVVFPKHWWEGTDANGRKRDMTQPSLEPPLGSGAYKIESFKPGSEIVWSRVKDYWAADLPVNVGRNNFDRRRYVYIQDDNAAWQAFTKGGFEDIQVENSSRRWSTEYNFPAVKAGDVIKREFKNESGEPMQGFVLNMRRPQFQDRRVRQALTLAYNFEIMNRTLFYGLNTRTDSYFKGRTWPRAGCRPARSSSCSAPTRTSCRRNCSRSRSSCRSTIPRRPNASISNRPSRCSPRPAGRSAAARCSTRRASSSRLRYSATDPTDEVISTTYIESLRKIGIDASLRIVDPAQYVNRYRSFDFDCVTAVTGSVILARQ